MHTVAAHRCLFIQFVSPSILWRLAHSVLSLLCKAEQHVVVVVVVILVVVVVRRSCCVGQSGLKLAVLLPQPPSVRTSQLCPGIPACLIPPVPLLPSFD